jgi:hypothetical protein
MAPLNSDLLQEHEKGNAMTHSNMMDADSDEGKYNSEDDKEHPPHTFSLAFIFYLQ